jgi:signal-transduction protein with cAMP-binding, CBS, and nucleotidyltransferase domain
MMRSQKITSLFIVEDGRLAGALHMHDLLSAGL